MPPSPGEIEMYLGDARQAIVITTDGWNTSHGRVARYERTERGWKAVDREAHDATIGRNGFALSPRGEDEQTPAGVIGLSSVFGHETPPADRALRLPFHTVAAGECWVTDTASNAYNRWVMEPSPQWCKEHGIDMFALADRVGNVIVTDYNVADQDHDTTAGIFVHKTEYDAGDPPVVVTRGSITMPQLALNRYLDWLDPAKHPVIIAGPRDWLLGQLDPPEPASKWRSLKFGARSDAVRELQQALNDIGYRITIDGYFGRETQDAVKRFQKDRELKVDGVVGSATARALKLLE
jgi:L,D-peptidoglycan transpeptidase YkuD (ErfK/YbiS/YcfS/YnhG family)